MANLTKRLAREFRTMERMVAIYCANHHVAKTSTDCDECREFLAYAERRLEKCPYEQAKPTWTRCPIHCYKKSQREKARIIMRYAGPRMTLRHPWLAAMHIFDKFRSVEHPMTLRARKRGTSN